MRKGLFRLSGLVLFLVLTVAFRASAQYEDILHPQTQEERALYAKLKVKVEKQAVSGSALSGLQNTVRVFSPEGWLMGSFEYGDHRYFLYDQNGRVTALLDSAMNADNQYDVSEYHVQYSSDGRPTMMTDNKTQSIFTYEPAKAQLTEKLNADSPATNIYRYNKAGALVSAQSFDKYGDLMSQHLLEYGDNGLLVNEFLVNYYEDSKDSMTIFYLYDNNKRLKSKQVFLTNQWYVEHDKAGNPTREAAHQEAGIYKYTYNDKGQLIAEDFTNSATDDKSHRYTYLYYDNGLKLKETRLVGKQIPAVIDYTYSFYQ